jgi:hypothetical protein
MPMGGGMPMGGPPAPAKPEPSPAPAPAGGEGMDAMVGSLESVGAFLKAQQESGNPAAQKAMGSFQALLSDMAALGGKAPGGPEGSGGPMDLEQAPKPEGGIPDSQRPGVKVL